MNMMHDNLAIWSTNWYGKEIIIKYFHNIYLMKKKGILCNIPLPSVFVIKMKKGEGFSFLSQKITDILYYYQLFNFFSKEQLIEFSFEKDTNNMKLLKQKVDQATVYTNSFCGVQAWDMDIPMRYMNEHFLKEIGKYLRENEGKVCFLIRVYSDNKKDIDPLLATIGRNVNFVFMDIPMLKTKDKLEIVLEWLALDGFKLVDEAYGALEELIEQLSSMNSYAGLRTIRRSLDELELFTVVSKDCDFITKEGVVEYTRQYLDAHIKMENSYIKKIGF